MSDSAFTPSRSTHDSEFASALRRGATAVRRWLETVGFWAAVVLPLPQIALLVGGLTSASDALAFAALVGLNLVSLVVGRDRYDD